MAKKPNHPVKRQVSAEATIQELVQKLKEEKIKFTNLFFEPEQQGMLTELIHNKARVMLTIKAVNENESYEPISAEGNIKSCTSKIDCQHPDFTGLRFSSSQIQELIEYQRAETELLITITQMQEELPFEEDQQE
jgi:hypothetical protein